ncbi:hypothetical protein O6P43_001847 [Quillaja saponaria]|uniref:Uncharacterized protein n=1 Tax=Quillaja saponaria TaxID=32244 RepID=A0AAD7VNM1_QUISA|nr:hypothetical protein O6P43_001847 [Quillaja saponaria]
MEEENHNYYQNDIGATYSSFRFQSDEIDEPVVLFDRDIVEEVNLNELTPRTKKRIRNELQENVDVGDDDDDINDEEDEAEEAE